MNKVNVNDVEELAWTSPKGKFAGFGKQVSEALGRDRNSTDVMQRHPFDIEILRVAPKYAPYVYHSHSAQWEFYHVISGSGRRAAQRWHDADRYRRCVFVQAERAASDHQ